MKAIPKNAPACYPVPLYSLWGEESSIRIRTKDQRRVQARADELSVRYGVKNGLSPQEYLMGPGGMAALFSAMNDVYGNFFSVRPEELSDPFAARSRARQYSNQFIFDVQTHFVRAQFHARYYIALRLMGRRWNPGLRGEKPDLDKVRFNNYMQELFGQSDTKTALLTSAPHDNPDKWFLDNDDMAQARDRVNTEAGRKKLYCHALVTPRHPGWMDELDRAISVLKPDAWKCYTTGAPFAHSRWPWRLDDEKLMYPAYEKMVRSGIRNVCLHKGLLPPFYRLLMHGNWKYDRIDDLPRAARDWPQLNFIVYHSALKHGSPPSRRLAREMETTGAIPWVSDLAEMPERYGLRNVYAELGSTFAITAVSNPRYCSAMLGTLIKGMGADHVLWGTDSVWYGSPQWQIEAFRRMEIPEDLRGKLGFAKLGTPDGEIKQMIFGRNAAGLYNVTEATAEKKAA